MTVFRDGYPFIPHDVTRYPLDEMIGRGEEFFPTHGPAAQRT